MTLDIAILAFFTFAALAAICAVADRSEMSRAKGLLAILFPIPQLGTGPDSITEGETARPNDSREKAEYIEARDRIRDGLYRSVEGATDKTILKELRDIAVARVKSEDDRQSSIMSRAQGLLTGLSFFGLVLTFAGTFLGSIIKTNGQGWAALCALIAAYILVMIVLVTFSVLRAIRGLFYQAPGNSDFAKWAALSDDAQFYRAQALMAFDHSRHARINNDWRFRHLTYALDGLRNIVYAVTILALTVLVLNLHPESPLSPLLGR